MKINATDAFNSATAIARIIEKVEVDSGTFRHSVPDLSASPSQLNRSYEVMKDPPVTVLKFTNPDTDKVEYQFPTDVSIRVYREIQNYLKKQEEESKRV